MFLYSAVSSPLARSKRFTLHPPADLFIPAPTRLLWEAFSHAAYCAKTSITFSPLSIARWSFIQLSELGRRGVNESAQTSKQWEKQDRKAKQKMLDRVRDDKKKQGLSWEEAQPFYIQPAIFPQLTWGGHFTGGSLTPPISARMNHWFRIARSRERCRKLDATKLYPTEPFSSSHHAMFKPAACDVTM